MTINTFTLFSEDLDGRIAAALDATRAGIPVILLDDFATSSKPRKRSHFLGLSSARPWLVRTTM